MLSIQGIKPRRTAFHACVFTRNTRIWRACHSGRRPVLVELAVTLLNDTDSKSRKVSTTFDFKGQSYQSPCLASGVRHLSSEHLILPWLGFVAGSPSVWVNWPVGGGSSDSSILCWGKSTQFSSFSFSLIVFFFFNKSYPVISIVS